MDVGVRRGGEKKGKRLLPGTHRTYLPSVPARTMRAAAASPYGESAGYPRLGSDVHRNILLERGKIPLTTNVWICAV